MKGHVKAQERHVLDYLRNNGPATLRKMSENGIDKAALFGLVEKGQVKEIYDRKVEDFGNLVVTRYLLLTYQIA